MAEILGVIGIAACVVLGIAVLLKPPVCPTCKRWMKRVFNPNFGEEGSGAYWYCRYCDYFPGFEQPPKEGHEKH